MYEHRAMTAGDRVPNITLADQRGKPFSFYREVQGGGIAIFVVSRADRYCAKLLQVLKEKTDAFGSCGAHMFAICDDSKDTKAETVSDLPFPLLSDGKGNVVDYLTKSARTSSPAVFILDSNQRILSVEAASDGDPSSLVEQALSELKKLLPTTDPEIFSAAVPALIVPNLIDRDLCKRLMKQWETHGNFEGKVGADENAHIDPTMKRRRDHLIEDPLLISELSSLLMPRVGHEVFKCFYFDDWRFEVFRVGCYDASDAGFFRVHRDTSETDNTSRRFALSLNLNAEDYEGGTLRFPEYSHNQFHPPTGAGVIFPCTALHEVLPVTKGRRFVLLTFLKAAKG